MSTDVNKPHLESAAGELFAAEQARLPVVPITQTYTSLTNDDAHWIQSRNIARKLEMGEKLVGYKLGLTSREAQKQFKVFQPDYGQLTSGMNVWEDGEIPVDQLIQPKIEGEIALVLKKDLSGPVSPWSMRFARWILPWHR